MDRWNGVLKIQLHPNSNAFYRIAASLGVSPSSRKLSVPSGNAIFFCGDRVEGTGNPVIDRLSDPQKIAEILVSKFGPSIDAYVIEASVFNGPFAVYKDFIPSSNEYGEPKSYDAAGFPASASLVNLLSKFLVEAKPIILGKQKGPYQAETSSSCSCKPRTALLGFSKGGTILNQFITELAFCDTQPTQLPPQATKNLFNGGTTGKEDVWILPFSKESFLNSIAEIHYVDVGLNKDGAYITDKEIIDKISERLIRREFGIRFLFHGTPRQWRDERRIWIRKEKDALLRLLIKAAQKNMGKLHVRERLYFPDKTPDMQMHFEIIENLNLEWS